jgi:hypothetical protein
MRNARSFTVLSGLLALIATGCSGGGSAQDSTLSVHCIGGQAFCIISCDLGCSQTGCSVTEIAENQRLRFAFSNSVDPSSVNNASISIRTITGVPPDGEYLVSGREVTFVPRVRTVGGTTTFGFARNESYVITLAGGPTAAQGVHSTSGAALTAEFSCTVLASRGILDEDQLPPTCELISPTNVTEAPVNPTIVLRFSELIDTTPLEGPLTVSSPMRVLLRHRTALGACDYDGEGVSLEGVPQLSTEIFGQGGSAHLVSVVTFQSPVQLPGNSCITVGITSDLRDISGRAAVPANFEILTVAGVSVPIQINETFQSNSGFDPLISGGTWQNGAHPAFVGGDGRHGSFNYTYGNLNAATGEFEFNNNNFAVTPERSLTGLPYVINDGKYYFTDFVVPENIKVRFTGTIPAQVYVRGQADIRGTIDVSAAEMGFRIPPVGEPSAGLKVTNFDSRGPVPGSFVNGQPGGAPGCGGGRGGNGANECHSTGPDIVPGLPPPYNGRDGEDLRLPAGHAYGGLEVGTGGKGGLLMPASGLTDNTALIATLYRAQFSQGGSGGGYMLPGGQSTLGTPLLGVLFSPLAPPGAQFPLLPWPPAVPPPGYSALNHFLIGGSGGGGGGSSPYGTFGFSTVATTPPNVYQAGHGGTGGGGAVAIRTGGSIVVATTGILRSKGGVAHLINGDAPGGAADLNWGVSSPGGGGSGGSFLLQSSVSVTFNGNVDTGGGVGGRTGGITPTSISQVSQAGSGATGFYHFQAPGSAIGFAGTATPAFNPATNKADLTDRDTASGCTSTWRTSGLIFPPQWLRYELDVDENGDGTIDTTYTDSGLPGTVKANDPNGPVVILFQGSRLNQAGTEPLPGEPVRPWRDGIGSGPTQGIGINVDTATGFRFMMTYNTGLFPNVVIRALRVFART